MGFYGNITNTSNTTFSFDRIYPNRLSMEANANNDGIFIGRYVLIEYDQDAAYPNIYMKKETDGEVRYYSSPNCENETRIQYRFGGRPAADVSRDVFYLGEFGQKQAAEKTYFYMCNGYVSVTEKDNKTYNYATFQEVTSVNKNEASSYLINYNIDYTQYKNAKGYDSTVWTKTTDDLNGQIVTKYRNIADLNSVVPTFDLETDAPTMTPITPHFDADSTNVYYKLHTQPQWGLRVAEKKDETNSDGVTTWIKSTYNPTTGEIETTKNENVVAAINYNGPAFEEQVDKNRKTETGIKKHDNSNNYITILPTGESGQTYYTHTNQNGEKVYEKAPDIQEMRISLPAIGNMMSDAWDIIHGPYRNDDMREFDTNGKNVSSLKGRLDSIDALEDDTVPVKRDTDGKLVGNKINGGKTSNTDYTGRDDDEWIETLVNGNEEKITIHHTYDLENKNNYRDIGHLEGKLNNSNDTINSINLNDGTNTLDINTPIVDTMGHVVGRNTETVTLPYGYKTIKVTNTGDDAILNAAQAINLDGQIADNTQDELTLSASNRWIKLDNSSEDTIKFGHQVNPIEEKDKDLTDLNDGTDTITIQDTIYDEAGHVTANQKHTYTLPYGYKYIEVANDGNTPAAPASTTGTQEADSTQDTLKLTTSNKWVLLDGSVEDTVQFGHLLKTIAEDKKPTQNLSSEESKTITFEVYDDNFDEAGHHNGRDTKTLTMPFGYGKIKGDNGNTAATATYDELNIVSGDDWINTEASKDTVTITHTGPVVTAVETKSNIENPSFGSTFTIEDWHFDSKGHMHTLGKTHTVQFPKGNIIHPTAYSNNTEIITSLDFNPESGVISYQKDNSGTLKLTANYTNEGINSGSISGGDSLNTALAKLEKQVMKEANDRNLAISSAISAVVDKDDDGTINKLAEVIDWINNNPSTATQMQIAIQDNIKAIGNEKTRAEGIEAGLQEQIDTLQAWKETATEDIANLNGTISQLLETINDLTTRIENLENPPQVPDEGGETV